MRAEASAPVPGREVPRQGSEPSALPGAQDAGCKEFTAGRGSPRAQAPGPGSPNSPQGGAPGCGRGSGPEAEGSLAAAAASAAAAFPPPRSQSISVQCRLPPPSRAREKEGGPRMGCALPRGAGPASPPRPPFQHRGQRPARQRPVSLSAAWALRPLRCVLIPSASFPPAHGGRLRPSPAPQGSAGGAQGPPMARGASVGPSRAGLTLCSQPAGQTKAGALAAQPLKTRNTRNPTQH